MVTPDISQWKSSYDYIDSLPISGLAWEWLRHNPNYQADYAAIKESPGAHQSLLKKMRLRWGLYFPRPP